VKVYRTASIADIGFWANTIVASRPIEGRGGQGQRMAINTLPRYQRELTRRRALMQSVTSSARTRRVSVAVHVQRASTDVYPRAQGGDLDAWRRKAWLIENIIR